MTAQRAVKRIAVLGCSGSIGRSTLAVVAAYPQRFRAVALAAAHYSERLLAQVRQFQPEVVALQDMAAATRLAADLMDTPIQVLSGEAGVATVAAWPTADLVVSAVTGFAGLAPTLQAIRAGKDVALANKECLVAAGQLFMDEVRRHGVALIPIDSEHNAVFQVLNPQHELRQIILTASGGPFLGWDRDRLARISVEQALHHPTWTMGAKITIDSATLMNKGLEVIEAHWLFGVAAEKIAVIVHPESVIHSIVEYQDGSMLAQMGVPDMRTPIVVALAWPERVTQPMCRLDLTQLSQLTFRAPDRAAFACLDLAYQALRTGGLATTILNAANEVAVAAFLAGRIGFTVIADVIRATLEAVPNQEAGSFSVVFEADRLARATAQRFVDHWDDRGIG
ncbi:MAG: 1-deoxy-D-xylulose-5-phosphate reductoisomerase [Magnetococcales bacterium]|nr:1-deoxy-D-xylulose-5-phosphate reductoisomerase [Magnetococcales bacterium]